MQGHNPLSTLDTNAKTNALIAYGLMIVGLFTGVFWLIGAIWAMVKRGDARDSIFVDHYTNIIKLFWWGLLFSVIGAMLTVIVIGYLILFVVWVWSIFKLVKGIARLTSNQAYE